ncbi:MAG: glycoside hydrolase family 130 protein [candidate division KSB1 bacterium]|nr:glycoside hydrolase family 130 protein [candidate division KSB1 bacterium]
MSVVRYKNNPILTAADVPFRVNSIFNAGAFKDHNGYHLLCRVEKPEGHSELVLAHSSDGFSFRVEEKPCLTPEMHGDFYRYVEWGVEDPRITRIADRYYILYTGYSRHAPLVMLAETGDFRSFIFHGPITEPCNKDAALFPEKINGWYWKIDRPLGREGRGEMWINRSADLEHWGEYRLLLSGANGTWEEAKIGLSTPPVRTEAGWLLLYHGVRILGYYPIYRLGVMLLSIHEPWRVLGRSRRPILSPETEYERIGDVPNVVFSTGWIIEKNGDVKIYYSGADVNICLAETRVDYLIDLCLDDPSRPKG